jgi:mobilization protein NikA
MRKRGRPTKAAKDRRGTVLRLRLTREEYKALCASAEKAGISVSAYARKLICGGNPQWKA